MNQEEQKQKPPPVPEAQDKLNSNTPFFSVPAASDRRNSDTDNCSHKVDTHHQNNTSRDNTSNHKLTAHCTKSNLQSSSMALCANSTRVGPINAHPTHILMVPNTVTVTRTIPVANCSVSTSNSGVSCSSSNNNTFKRMRPMTETHFGPTPDQGENQQQKENHQQEKAPIHGFNVQLNDVSSSMEDACGSGSGSGSGSGVAPEHSTSAMVYNTAQQQAGEEGNSQQIDTSTMQMTVEQIDDVIDKVDLPTNFSFPSSTMKRKPKARKAPILPISPKRAKVYVAAPQCAHPSSTDVKSTNANALVSITPASAFTPPPTTSASFSTPSKKRKATSSSLSPRKPSPSDTNTQSTISSSSSTKVLNPTLKTPTSGRWTREEHEAFLEGLKIFGREWKKVAQNIPTRTSAQIRSHAQKYFAKLARDEQQQAANASLGLGYAPNLVMGNVAGSLGIAGEVGLGDDGLKGGAVGSGGEFTQSVLERVDKILKDPRGAQLEVEETLTRLRARYNELQEKLFEKQRKKEQEEYQRRLRQQEQYELQKMGVADGHGQWVNPNDGQSNSLLPSTNIKFAPLAQAQNVVESVDHEHSTNLNRPDMETLSNALMSERFSAGGNSRESRLSPITLSTQSLKLHSEELIALHVLGGELYRSASRENLSNMHRSDSHRLPSEEPQGSPGSDTTDKKDNCKQQGAHDNQNN